MATTLTITPQTTSISATSDVTTLTISSAVAGLATDAQGVTFQNAARTISDADNVEDALLILQSLLIDKTKNIDIHYSDHKLIKYFYYPCIFNQARSISDIDQKYNKSDILTINYGL